MKIFLTTWKHQSCLLSEENWEMSDFLHPCIFTHEFQTKCWLEEGFRLFKTSLQSISVVLKNWKVIIFTIFSYCLSFNDLWRKGRGVRIDFPKVHLWYNQQFCLPLHLEHPEGLPSSKQAFDFYCHHIHCLNFIHYSP